MSSSSMKPEPAETPAATLDAQLRAWFDSLLAQPVPEALLRHLDRLEKIPGEPG